MKKAESRAYIGAYEKWNGQIGKLAQISNTELSPLGLVCFLGTSDSSSTSILKNFHS
jgi:hypothetical protein